MCRVLSSIVIILMIISCAKKDGDRSSYNFRNESGNFDLIYPLELDSSKDNFIEIKNYHSKYDSIKEFKRYPIVCLFIEDTIIDYRNNIIQITGDKLINFGEFYVYDEKFRIPSKLIMNKKGKYKLTVAIVDILARDTIKADPNVKGDEDKLEMDFLDMRTFHDIEIK